MPIEGLSQRRRIPRLGKIKLGTKDGRGIPSKADHFVCPPEVQAVFGEKPIKLDIMIPLEDEELWASQWYRAYSNVRGLLCKGDGKACMRIVNADTGKMADKDAKEGKMTPLTCPGRECDYVKAKRCKPIMNLQFVLPDVPGVGVWQVDTSSINSITNINSATELIRSIYGRIAWIPLQLTLEPIEVNNPESGKKQKVFVLNLRSNLTLKEIVDNASKFQRQLGMPSTVDLPVSDDEMPEDLFSEDEQQEEWAQFHAKLADKGITELQLKERLGAKSLRAWVDQGHTLEEALAAFPDVPKTVTKAEADKASMELFGDTQASPSPAGDVVSSFPTARGGLATAPGQLQTEARVSRAQQPIASKNGGGAEPRPEGQILNEKPPAEPKPSGAVGLSIDACVEQVNKMLEFDVKPLFVVIQVLTGKKIEQWADVWRPKGSGMSTEEVLELARKVAGK